MNLFKVIHCILQDLLTLKLCACTIDKSVLKYIYPYLKKWAMISNIRTEFEEAISNQQMFQILFMSFIATDSVTLKNSLYS